MAFVNDGLSIDVREGVIIPEDKLCLPLFAGESININTVRYQSRWREYSLPYLTHARAPPCVATGSHPSADVCLAPKCVGVRVL